jgi:C4-dicarboxylate transporter DctM subunit
VITPPVGLNLYLVAGSAGMSLGAVTRAAPPWMLALVAALLVITYVPWRPLFLVDMLY